VINTYNISVSESLPVTEPVTLAEAKAFIGVDYDDHDDLLTDIKLSAREDIEAELNWKLVESSVVVYVDTTKDETVNVLPHTFNLSHVDSDSLIVSGLVDGESDEVLTIDDDYYFNGSLKLGEGSFKLEYDIVPVVPNSIKEAIKMLVAYRYNNRGDQDKQNGFPADVEAKISRYRMIWL
jgi:hypothetical protein